MIKLRSYFVLASIFLSFSVAAKTIHLNPSETKTLANDLLFTLNATCNVHSLPAKRSKIRIVMVKNKGVVNGHSLTSGQASSLMVTNNSSISVSADSGSQIHLTNLSADQLEAVCFL
ncbi:MAG: hypothetical protein CK426_08780 [Legionella sp.]|nr:MAG: hypothetical protein CK423_07215 [Legionella sp.]PJD97156.1 MAG: hypothetical protein CK426_08780 [Legionella sp.]